ncbi:MAG: hypothetical protein O2954_10970 [bacterium]|nr:hypothetical protein [bacterium]
MGLETETALFKKARVGDREAFDRLQEALESQVRRFVARLIGTQGIRDWRRGDERERKKGRGGVIAGVSC